MRKLSKLILTLSICLCLTSSIANASNLSGSRNYGISFDAGTLVFSTGITLDYEIAPDLYLTFDMQTKYSKVSKSLSRIELSTNWYPDWWILKGWCVSIGGALRTEVGPQVFLEFSTPFSLGIPKLVRFWEWF